MTCSPVLHGPGGAITSRGCALPACGSNRSGTFPTVARSQAGSRPSTRRSDLKDITPDAVDIFDLTAAARVDSQAENERRIVEMERNRLRMEEVEKDGR